MNVSVATKGTEEFKDEIRKRGASLQVLIDEEEKRRREQASKSQTKNFLWLTLSDGERFLSGHPGWFLFYTLKTRSYVRLKKEVEDAEEQLTAATKKREEEAGQLRAFVDKELVGFDPEFSVRMDVFNSLICVRSNASALIGMLDDYVKNGQPGKLVINLQSIIEDAATVVVRVIASHNAEIQALASMEGIADFTGELPLGDIPEILSAVSDECTARSKFCRINKRIKVLSEEAGRRIAVLEEEIRRYRSAYLESVAKEKPDGKTVPVEGVA